MQPLGRGDPIQYAHATERELKKSRGSSPTSSARSLYRCVSAGTVSVAIVVEAAAVAVVGAAGMMASRGVVEAAESAGALDAVEDAATLDAVEVAIAVDANRPDDVAAADVATGTDVAEVS